jgi:hypothetical protein
LEIGKELWVLFKNMCVLSLSPLPSPLREISGNSPYLGWLVRKAGKMCLGK